MATPIGNELAAVLASLRSATAEAKEVTRRQHEERVALSRDNAEFEEQRARAARAGAHGEDWREVQQRIDAGRTTFNDVLAGRDDSPAAQRIAQQTAERLVATTAQMNAQLNAPGATALRDAAQLSDELRQVIRSLHAPGT